MDSKIITLVESYNKLIDNNRELTKVTNKAMQQSLSIIEEHKEILSCCGELYKLLESKTNKTWLEDKCIKRLLALITYSELT